MLARILGHAQAHPGRLAVVQDGTALDYSAFAGRILGARGYLQGLGLPDRGLAAVCCHRLLDAWTLGLALRSLGLDTVATSDLAHLRSLGIARLALVAAPADEARPGLDAAGASGEFARVAVPRERLLAGWSQRIPSDFGRREGGHVMLTSGTTGRYKKVLRDAAREALLLPLHASINAIDADSLVYASGFGLWTAGGYRWPLLAWHAGGGVVFHQQADLHRPLARHRFSHMFATPALLEDLLAEAGTDLPRCEGMRLYVTGGETSPALARQVKHRLGARLFSVLASTEALTVAVTEVHSDQDLHWHRLHPSREVQVVDEAGQPLRAGEPGRVRIRILDGLDGYLDDPAASRDFFRDGWFHPGDLGVMDGQGRLALLGRESDVVNVRGNKLATAAMERALGERLGAATCILGLHRDGVGEELHVVVEGGMGIDAAQCEAALSAELAPLRSVHVHFDVVPRLPRNAMGKVRRDELRRQLLSGERRTLG